MKTWVCMSKMHHELTYSAKDIKSIYQFPQSRYAHFIINLHNTLCPYIIDTVYHPHCVIINIRPYAITMVTFGCWNEPGFELERSSISDIVGALLGLKDG